MSQQKYPGRKTCTTTLSLKMEKYQRKSSCIASHRIASNRIERGLPWCASPIDRPGWDRKIYYWNKSPQIIVDTPLLEETTSQRGGASKFRVSNTESKRCKWSEDGYVAVTRAYCEAKHHLKGSSCTEEICSIWRNKNKSIRPSIDANKLANVRRDILTNKRLSENQLNVIEQEILLSCEKSNVQGLEPSGIPT